MTYYIDGRTFKTKKAFKEEVAASISGERIVGKTTHEGVALVTPTRRAHPVYVYEETMFAPTLPPKEGETRDVAVVGPGPYDRKWYATATIDHEFRVVKVK